MTSSQGPNGATGVVFFQMYTSYRNMNPRLAYQVYHTVKGTNYSFFIQRNGQQISPVFKYDTLGTSYIVPLTRELWNNIVAGSQLVLFDNDSGATVNSWLKIRKLYMTEISKNFLI